MIVKSGAPAPEETKEFKTLLVEDHVGFRHAFKAILHKEFPEMLIEEAANRIETLQKVTSFAPDLTFMDIQLKGGGVQGLELIKEIKNQHPHIKIVILTTFDLPEYREAAQQYGIQDFLIKGLTPLSEVLALVKSVSSKFRKPI